MRKTRGGHAKAAVAVVPDNERNWRITVASAPTAIAIVEMPCPQLQPEWSI